MENALPVYIPNSRVCHMEQYHCCKYRQHCRLYPICSKIALPTVCVRDCPECFFTGCSLSMEARQAKPVYIRGEIQCNRLDLNLDGRKMQEKLAHQKKHFAAYQYYNRIFGNLLEHRREYQRKRYWSDPVRARALQRNYYRKKHPLKKQSIPEKYMPECSLNCASCQHSDCILPENWLKQAQSRIYYQENPEYFRQYREKNKDKRSAYDKDWYQKHKAKKKEKQKARRADPAVKKRRAEYDRKYRKEHPDSDREKHRRYYQRHKDEINAKKRAKRAEQHQ